MWQTGGAIHVWRDLCIHRGANLSLGKITQACLACPYHDWRYAETGACVHIPAHPHQMPPAKAIAQTYPVQIRYDLVWTCLGEPAYELESTAWFVVATNTSTDHERLRVEYTPRIGAIFAEDRTIVESQRPELLPLALQAELHLRSDRMAIGYRTWLRRLGLRYGAV